jgi:hypothetical protein
LWTYVRDDRPAGDQTPPAVWFAYTPDRKGEHPQAHLSKFKGTLQADAYAGFEQIYATGNIQEAACWAHVRRKFYDLQVAHKSLVAEEALKRIGELYAVESEINGRSPEERHEIRHARSRPLLGSLKQWLEETLVKLSKKSDTAMAVRYALGRWDALMRYCDDGHLEIDNNAAERALRAVALGRKNYLFAESDRGGLQSDRNSQAEQDRSRKLSAERSVTHRGTSDQQHRRTAALESRPGTICETMKPTEDKLLGDLFERITNLYQQARGPFPYAGCRKLYALVGEEAKDLIPDLDLYFSDLAGYCSRGSRVVKMSAREISHARKTASKSFFEVHPKYDSLRVFITEAGTPDLFRCLDLYKQLRVTLLEILDQMPESH